MSHDFVSEFCFIDWSEIDTETDQLATDAEKYGRIADWALQARQRNPNAFDAVTGWIRDDSQWSDPQLADNERVLMDGIVGRFKEQNAQLRAALRAIEPSGVVNTAVFAALDRFDEELSGTSHDAHLRDTVARVFADFSAMRERGVREIIAGERTGPAGVDREELYGYINDLKDCDAKIQWTLFMPDMVADQQKGFWLESFTYQKLPAMRFIGREDERLDDPQERKKLFAGLDVMSDYASGFDHDVWMMHHDGLSVNIGPWQGLWGRFLQANAPVPNGFVHIDFVPESNREAGPPYISQFAFAKFSGDFDAMHARDGYDVDAMYDVTRNTILGEGVIIPYPDKYWTAEVFLNGADVSTAYMFSVEL